MPPRLGAGYYYKEGEEVSWLDELFEEARLFVCFR